MGSPSPSGVAYLRRAPRRLGIASSDEHARAGEAWTPRQRLKNDVIFRVARVALATVTRLPRLVVGGLCAVLAFVAWGLLAEERRRVRARLEGAWGRRATVAEVRAPFRAAAATLADIVALFDPAEPADRTLELDPESARVFRDGLRDGRGVVFISAHLGSWERLAALMASEGFPCATVARESYDRRFTALYDRLRAPRGVRSIYRGRAGAAVAIARELRRGRAVGFLIDLPSRVASRREHLFGATSQIAVGPARLALARRAVVLVGTVVPAASARSRVVVERVATEDLARGEEGERALLRRMLDVLEARIALAPETWLGLFSRISTEPPSADAPAK